MKKTKWFQFGIIVFTLIWTVNVSGQRVTVMEGLTAYQQLAHDIFKQLIEINTSVSIGSTKAAEAMALRLKAAGFPEKDIQVIGPAPQHMNLVVRYKGNSSHSPILFFGHLDVVEALRQDWSFDPFKFLEKDGYFYGRGTSDMKCDDANGLASLIRLRQEGFIPDRDIIIALTEDEEGGDYNGINWLLANQRDLISSEFCFNMEGGGGDIKDGRHTLMEIQTSEKIYMDFNLEVKNKGGHSSLPVRENAIYSLASALLKIADFGFPIRLNETTQMYFERNAVLEKGQVKTDMLAMKNNPIDIDAANRLARLSPYYNSLMRTTCVATMLSGGHATNALPQTARANVNCRMLPDDTPENVLSVLRSVVADTMVKITTTYTSVIAPRSKLPKNILDIVENLTASMWPGVIVTPVMSTGATDGKYLRAAGFPVFGISGIFADIDDIRAHGRDERIGVKEFYEGSEFMYRFMKALTSGSR